MIRVLHFLLSLNAAGAETVIMNYFNHIDTEKVMFDFCIKGSNSEGCYSKLVKEKGSIVFLRKYAGKQYFKFRNEIKQLLSTNHYDIVHINTGSAKWAIIAKIAKQCGVKNVIYHSHSSSGSFSSRVIQRILKPSVDRWSDYRFACSRRAGDYTFNTDYSLLNNAIDLKSFSYDPIQREALRSKYGIKTSEIVIGHVGRLSWEKNHMFLLKLIPYIETQTRNFKLVFVGEGRERQTIEEYIKKNSLENHVILTGNVGDKVKKYYSMFDVFVFPSIYEGLSLVNIEAQANGLPIVASNTISYEHKIASNYFFKPIDDKISNLEDWVQTIIDNVGNRRDNLNNLINAGYDIETEAKKLQQFYLQIAGE